MQQVINSEGTVYGQIVSMELIICYQCGVPFAIPQHLKKHFQDSQEAFCCPHGHRQSYSKSTVQIEREKSEREKASLEAQILSERRSKEYYADKYKNERKQTIVLKGQKTKLINRVKNGVCICCNRSFSNLAEHMKKQHPEILTSSNNIDNGK